jgi:uncharacterized membrane protein YbaN (DUF454 family)
MGGSIRERLRKGLWVGLGSIFLAVGLIGILVPLLPTTPFLILAAGCYAKGSQRFYDRLLASPYLGSYIRAYKEGSTLTWRWRLASIAFLWVTMTITMLIFVDDLLVRAILIVIAIVVTAHLATVGRKRRV